MSVRARVSTSKLVARFKSLESRVPREVDSGVSRLESGAERTAIRIINRQIYETPPRPPYVRTGALRDSIYAVKDRSAKWRWAIMVGAVGGAGGRSYALYNERGTRAGRVSLSSIRARALAETARGLILLEYGDPASGLEPRPWVIPTVVMTAREFERVFLDAVRGGAQALALAAD